MINLNKQRIAVYMYLLLVFTLIFGLSFSVQGNEITGSFILDIASNFTGKISSSLILIMFGFLLSLVFSLFILRHAQEIKRDIKPEKIKYFAGIVLVLLAVSFLSFGVYFGDNEDKITGFASQEQQPPVNTFTPGLSFNFDKSKAISLGKGIYQAEDIQGRRIIFDTESSRGTVMYTIDPDDSNIINGYDKEGKLFFSRPPT